MTLGLLTQVGSLFLITKVLKALLCTLLSAVKILRQPSSRKLFCEIFPRIVSKGILASIILMFSCVTSLKGGVSDLRGGRAKDLEHSRCDNSKQHQVWL